MLTVKWVYPTMDDWQKELLDLAIQIIEHKNNKKIIPNLIKNFILLCGRQVGKSEIVSMCIAMVLLNVPNIKLLIVSGVERQASGLYNKVVNYISISHPRAFKEEPLRTKFILKNGSILITEPVGTDGSGARQHTLDGVIFEEMQLIPEEAYAAIIPMGLTRDFFIWMLGTAWATSGYAYERLSDPRFKAIRVNAEEVAEKRPEPSRSIMLQNLEDARKQLPASQYRREYMAIPSDKTRQIFPDALIATTLNLLRPGNIVKQYEYICGVDPAGLGSDEGSISIFKFDSEEEKMEQVDHIITDKLYTTQTTDKIVELNRQYDFKRIYVDDGGVGFGVYSELIKEDSTKFKTINLNNSARIAQYQDEKEKKLGGYDMIVNLLNQMEKGKVALLKDDAIRASLKSYTFEYSDTKKLMIASNYNHPVQSIMRAVWHLQEKSLKLQIHSIKV